MAGGGILPKEVDLTKVRLDIKGAWKWIVGAIAFFVLLEIAKMGAKYVMNLIFNRKAVGGFANVI